MNARPVGQPRVDKRRREIDPPPERRDEPLDDDKDLLLARESDRGLLEASVAFDPDAAQTIDHDLTDANVAQQRRERSKPEESIFQVPLELTQLAGRQDDTLECHRVPQRLRQLLAFWAAIGRLTQVSDDGALESSARRLGDHDASIESSSARSS